MAHAPSLAHRQAPGVVFRDRHVHVHFHASFHILRKSGHLRSWIIRGNAQHWSRHRDHVVHGVVKHVAVHDPVAGIIGDEFDVASLGHADEDVVAWYPAGFGNASSFRPGNPPRVPVKVNWVMIGRAEVHQPQPDALTQLDHQRCRQRRTRPLNVRKLNSMPWLSGMVELGMISNSCVIRAMSRSHTGS